ncbi:hypothetical protein FB45DRAFT_1036987 [Roridomyces roridus]|uniref:Uncharacterized protein n=1 Tax=Roridomyces roridus TaxID=1738132 RepID=A0AAD7FCW4_9AGAR|nr:hypothetical protein FB45DRAFT_1036987 [Roridomyces roridus]
MSTSPRFLEIGPDGLYHPVLHPPTALSARSSRALCRVLVTKHDVSPSAVAKEFGWARSTIHRAARNDYSPPDKDADALHLPENFALILEKVLKGDDSDESDEEGSSSRSSSISTTRSVKVQSSSTSTPPSPRTSRNASTAAPSRSTSTPSVTVLSRSPSPAPAPEFTLVTTKADDDFLKDFVRTHISLDPKWCLALKKAGFTKENLVRMARFPKAKIAEFIASKFPEMNEVQKFFFAEAVGKLGIIDV